MDSTANRTIGGGSLPGRLAALALLAVLVLAQTLGLVHRIAHAPSHAAGATIGAVAAPATAHDHKQANGPTAANWLQRLFAADGHAEACALYDQLSHADGLPGVPASWLPQAWVSALPPWQARWMLAAQAAGYLARGPPIRG